MLNIIKSSVVIIVVTSRLTRLCQDTAQPQMYWPHVSGPPQAVSIHGGGLFLWDDSPRHTSAPLCYRLTFFACSSAVRQQVFVSQQCNATSLSANRFSSNFAAVQFVLILGGKGGTISS